MQRKCYRGECRCVVSRGSVVVDYSTVGIAKPTKTQSK